MKIDFDAGLQVEMEAPLADRRESVQRQLRRGVPDDETKKKLTPQLPRRTAFLLYSEGGVSPGASALLAEAGVLVLDVDKLAGYEMPSKRF